MMTSCRYVDLARDALTEYTQGWVSVGDSVRWRAGTGVINGPAVVEDIEEGIGDVWWYLVCKPDLASHRSQGERDGGSARGALLRDLGRMTTR